MFQISLNLTFSIDNVINICIHIRYVIMFIMYSHSKYKLWTVAYGTICTNSSMTIILTCSNISNVIAIE